MLRDDLQWVKTLVAELRTVLRVRALAGFDIMRIRG